MKKFLNHLQLSYGYSDYEIELIEYFVLTMASELSKLIIIYGFFIYWGKAVECTVALGALLFLRATGGGFHCEHYISCFLMSFSFIFASIYLSEIFFLNRLFFVASMILCMGVAYLMVPVVSHHRPKPSPELISRSRIINFVFLIFGFVLVLTFYTNHFARIIFWVIALHTIQLLLTKIDKGGKYHVVYVDKHRKHLY